MGKDYKGYFITIEGGDGVGKTTAINALKDTPTDESDDLPAFSALGLKYRSYFSNGGNEQSNHMGADGNPLTWNQWNE